VKFHLKVCISTGHSLICTTNLKILKILFISTFNSSKSRYWIIALLKKQEDPVHAFVLYAVVQSDEIVNDCCQFWGKWAIVFFRRARQHQLIIHATIILVLHVHCTLTKITHVATVVNNNYMVSIYVLHHTIMSVLSELFDVDMHYYY